MVDAGLFGVHALRGVDLDDVKARLALGLVLREPKICRRADARLLSRVDELARRGKVRGLAQLDLDKDQIAPVLYDQVDQALRSCL